MSFRELRNFTEIMRALGYPRLISIENFRTPNFELVADTLYWLVQRYDPDVDFMDDISTESDRVGFLKRVAVYMHTKARVKLNIKKLYAADGFAVKELLKIATILYDAMRMPADQDEYSGPDLGAAAKFHDFKTTRTLAKEITERGAKLFDLLEAEWENRELRQTIIARNFETNEVERMVKESMQGIAEQAQNMDKMMTNLESDEKNLETKIEKKRTDLERNKKRLKSMKSVRPAFQDEYDKLEALLAEQYSLYIERFRNLEYLEHELDIHNKGEQDRLEENTKALKRMQKRLHDEELKIFRGESDIKDDDYLNQDRRDRAEYSGSSEEGTGRPDNRPTTTRGGRVTGNMGGGESDSDLDDESSDLGTDSQNLSINGDTDSDDDLIDDDDESMINSDDDSVEF